MSSQWMNKYAIMRDLSLAQGCVPVDLAGTLKAGDKPPSRNLVEETEEELYQSWVGGTGDFSAPDLGLIKHMLEEVRNQDATTKENENLEKIEFDKIIQISKLNPFCSEFKPKQPIAVPKVVVKEIPPKPKRNKKKDRNVAVQSLLQNMMNNVTNPIIDKDTLIPDNIKKPEATEKVLSWLETPKAPVHIKKSNNTPQLNLDPSSMFKKKNVSPDAAKSIKKSNNTLQLNLDPSSMFKKKNISPEKAKPVKEVKSTSQHDYGKYVPSDNVDEYYKQFLECSRMKQIVQENVWSKVERKMKEIDERRVAEAELFALSLALSREEGGAPPEPRDKDPIKQKLDQVFLSGHRHSLPGPCRVCELQETLGQPRDLTVTLHDACDRSDFTEDKPSDEELSLSFKDTLENVNESANDDNSYIMSDFNENTSDEEHSQSFKDTVGNVNENTNVDNSYIMSDFAQKTSNEEHSLSFKDTLENVKEITNVDNSLIMSDFNEKTSDEEYSQSFKDSLGNVNENTNVDNSYIMSDFAEKTSNEEHSLSFKDTENVKEITNVDNSLIMSDCNEKTSDEEHSQSFKDTVGNVNESTNVNNSFIMFDFGEKRSDEEHSQSFKDTVGNVNESTNVNNSYIMFETSDKTNNEEHSQNIKDTLRTVNLINNAHGNFHNMSNINNVKANDEQYSQCFKETQKNLNLKEFNNNKEVKKTSNTETSRNVSKSIVDEHIQNWKSKPVDNITNSDANKNSDKSNIEITTEPKTLYDDFDDIDAWKFEVLGDDGYDINEFYDCEQVYESFKVFNNNQSSQTYDVRHANVTVNAITNNVEKKRTLAQGIDETIENKVNNNNTSYEFQITKSEPYKLDDKQGKVGSVLNIRLHKLLQINASRFDYVLTKKCDDDDNNENGDDDDSKPVPCKPLETLENLSDSEDSDRTNKFFLEGPERGD